jgi:hypothetical protein
VAGVGAAGGVVAGQAAFHDDGHGPGVGASSSRSRSPRLRPQEGEAHRQPPHTERLRHDLPQQTPAPDALLPVLSRRPSGSVRRRSAACRVRLTRRDGSDAAVSPSGSGRRAPPGMRSVVCRVPRQCLGLPAHVLDATHHSFRALHGVTERAVSDVLPFRSLVAHHPQMIRCPLVEHVQQ